MQQFMQISEAPDEHDVWTLGVEALAEKKVSQKMNAERIASEALLASTLSVVSAVF